MNSQVHKLLPLVVLLTSLASAAAQAADATNKATAEPTSPDVVNITINSKSSSERFRTMWDFVGKLGEPVSGDVGYARMEEGPCFFVQNLPRPAMEYLTARLATAAKEAGLTAAKPDCAPNIAILFTEDSKALADSLVKKRQGLMKPFFNADGTIKGANALHAFATLDAPVRWWQITVPVDPVGRFFIPSLDPLEVGNDVVYTLQGTESRMTRSIRDRLLYTIVVVDLNKLGEATWDQLADYLAMVTLVQVKPDTSMAGYDTILNLFTKGARTPPEMSDWDKAYLQGVYALNRYLIPFSQRGSLTIQVLNHFYK